MGNSNKFFDPSLVKNLFNLPPKQIQVGKLMEHFESEYEYIKSLHLD